MPDPKRFKGEGAKKRFIEECMRQRSKEKGGKLTDQDKAICLEQSRRIPGKHPYPKKRKKKAISEILREMAN